THDMLELSVPISPRWYLALIFSNTRRARVTCCMARLGGRPGGPPPIKFGCSKKWMLSTYNLVIPLVSGAAGYQFPSILMTMLLMTVSYGKANPLMVKLRCCHPLL